MSRDALVVGINTYDHLRPLNAPAADAEAIAQILREKGEFNKIERLPQVIDRENQGLKTGKTTPINLKELEAAFVNLFLPNSHQEPDTALFYFSGHGLRKNSGISESFLAASDTNPEESNWGIRLGWLKEILSESRIKQKIIWLDCCYSGEVPDFTEARPGKNLSRDIYFLAACREFETAYEDISGEHGVFTQILLKGFKDSTLCLGPWLTNDDLNGFVNRSMDKFPQRPISLNLGTINLIRHGEQPKSSSSSVNFLPDILSQDICPYKGLNIFKTEDSSLFFGRDNLVRQLVAHVCEHNFLALLGPSGSGKSSVLQAGLISQLCKEQKSWKEQDRWRILPVMRPGEHPRKNLEDILIDKNISEVDRAIEISKVVNLLNRNTDGLKHFLRGISAPRILMIIDQFEEIFTSCEDEMEKQEFIKLILNCIKENKFCLIISMRADFFGKFIEQKIDGLAELIQKYLVVIPTMNSNELRSTITEPARQGNVEIKPELVELILKDIEKEPARLALLQFTLKQLWDNRTSNNSLSYEQYCKFGRLTGAIQTHANTVYESLEKDEKDVARHIFLSLVCLGEGTENTRRQQKKKNFLIPRFTKNLVDKTIHKLASHSLLVVSEDINPRKSNDHGAVVDIAHEALIQHWDRFHEWIRTDRKFIIWKEQVEVNARRWEESGKRRGELLRGSLLTEFQNFPIKQQSNLNRLLTEYIKKSRRLEILKKTYLYIFCTEFCGILFKKLYF